LLVGLGALSLVGNQAMDHIQTSTYNTPWLIRAAGNVFYVLQAITSKTNTTLANYAVLPTYDDVQNGLLYGGVAAVAVGTALYARQLYRVARTKSNIRSKKQ